MRSHAAAGPPGIHLPRLDSTGPLPRSRGSKTGRQTRRDRTCEAEAEGGCQCGAGALSLAATASYPPSMYLTHPSTMHTQDSLALGAGGAVASPNPLSEHGLTNTSSNESHHHDHDHATMSLFVCIFNHSSPDRAEFPPSGFSYPCSLPIVSGLMGLGRWPGRLHMASFSSSCRWLPQVRPMFLCVCVCVCVSASLFHLEYPPARGFFTIPLRAQSSFRPSSMPHAT